MRQVSLSDRILAVEMTMSAIPPVALRVLGTGRTGRFHEAQLDDQSVGLLRALGLSGAEAFRLCKAGEPCILQVGATRIGVSRTVASRIFVVPDPPTA